MRQYPPQYAAADAAAEKSPRFVVAILFDVASLYFTSHDDIPNVPGVVIEGVLEGVSATSQKINPDQARAEIGSMSFSLVDIDHQVRDAFRQKEVVDEKGLRGKTVRLYRGYAGFDFSAFVLFQTQQIEEIEYNEGTYHVSCRDIQRAQRKDIFEPVTTTLRLPVSESDTTIPVYDTSKFIAVAHGSSFSDGPNITCGYIKIGDEIIRWTGKTADSFTGCTRGVLNTRAVAHTVDAAASAERRPKVEEVIYLEMPAVKLAYAILTGRIHNSPNTLPDHWHLGIDPAEWIRESDFTENFPDVWNPANDSDGLILRFVGLKKTDGKAFLEKEIYLLLGAFSPIYSDGRLGLKRRVSLVGDSAPVAVLTERDIVSHSGLTHDMGSMHNVFRVEWNHNGKEFTRIHQFADAYSYDIHGKSDLKTLQFRGLYGSRATDATIWKILNFLRDGYSSPPLRLKVDLLPSLSQFEVGDCVQVSVENLQDYTGNTEKIDRAFEVQRVTIDHVDGDVSLELFGSTSRPVPDAPAEDPHPVPDAWYTSQGTALSSVVTISGGVVQDGTYNFNGGGNLNASAAILYHDGDLIWSQGAVLNLTGNLQLRVKGFLTFNGRINGKGGGLPGVAPNSNPLDPQIGNPGFVGSSRGRDGFNIFQQGGNPVMQSTPVPTTHGKYSAFPLLDVRVENGAVVGIPNDLRGTGGGPGGKVVYQTTTLRASGGAGGNGGAGVAIICRGIAFGASASIDLSGNDTSAPAPFIDNVRVWYPGAGGAGGPGALLILLDGTHHSIPDITGRFIGRIGRVGNPNDRVSTDFPGVEEVHFMESRSTGRHSKREGPYAGYEGPEILSELDLSNAAHRIQKIPPPQTPQEDIEAPPAAPTAMQLTATSEAITARITAQFVDPRDVLELWASIDNNRSNAVRVGFGRVTEFTVDLPSSTGRYFWTRMRRDYADRPDVFSDWVPSSPTDGLFASTPSAPNKESVFLDTFERRDLLTQWVNAVPNGTPTIDFPENGVFGGIVARIAGARWWGVHRDLIPYDPNTLYRITAGVRRTAAGNGQGNVYVGVTGVAADGRTLVNTTGENSYGSQHYVAASGQLPDVGTYTEYVGYFKGLGDAPFNQASSPANPTPLRTGVRFIRPTVIVNYDSGTGTTEIDYVRIDALTQWTGWTPVVTNGGGAVMLVDGTTIRKSGGVHAWDSQVYSLESYASGCAVSFRPLQTNADFMIGLNTDPTTDASYTSLDYAWFVRNNGFLQCYENGALVVSNAGTYDTSTTLSITYDGAYVRYLRNGTEVRKVPRIGERFHLDSSWYDPGGAAAAIQFVPLAPAPNTLALVARGNCVTQGNAITKVGGSVAWDSDCYSLAAYTACAVSWRAANSSGIYMIGLNSDPTTDQSYTSLDFALYCKSSSVDIYESGVPVANDITTVAADDVFSIRYDGQWVRYFKNSALLREKFAPGLTLFLDSSFNAPGSTALDVTFGPLTGATPDPYVARGHCKVSGTSIQKVGGSVDWGDADCHSIVGYPTCHLAWKVNETNTDLMVGLNTDPTTDQSYTSLDYAWHARADGIAVIYESGSLISYHGTYTPSTLFAITYDGSTVRYYKDDLTTPVRTVSAPGLTLFMDSAFYIPGAGVNSLDFGPGTQLAVIDTPQIGDNAATDVLVAGVPSTTITAVQFTPDSFSSNTTIATISYTPDFDCEITLSASFTVDYTTAGTSGFYYKYLRYSLQDGTFDTSKRQEFFFKGSATDTNTKQAVTVTWRFQGSKGVAVTYRLCGAKFEAADTCVITNAQMQLVAKKR